MASMCLEVLSKAPVQQAVISVTVGNGLVSLKALYVSLLCDQREVEVIKLSTEI